MIRTVILFTLLFVGCGEEKIYECDPFEERLCYCPDGSLGEQECSRGPAFSESKPPRAWKPCSCCYSVRRGEHGIHHIDYVDTSGCWDDIYDPSALSYEADTGDHK
jgi:hypothetical protein